MQKQPYIAFHGITKTFPGVKALDDISFSISAGEVHAIVGENGAGKSTLINVVAGNYHPESGQLEIKGFIKKKKMYEEAEKICQSIKLDVRANTLVGNLIPAKQQMVEIAKALSNESELLILDEPTATITEKETEILFQVIKEMKKKGISIIYISHRLQEIFNIADRVTVLKDGKYVGTRAISEVKVGDVIKMMVGRDLYTEKYWAASKEEIVLEVRNFRSSKFHDVNFELKHSEVLCFAGLAGAGRTEVARAVIGADPLEGGELYINGKKKRITNPEQAIANGIGYLPEDRKEQGLFLEMAIANNIVSGNLDLVSKNQIINEKAVVRVSEEYRKKLRIICPSVLTKARQLSGGNQQKIVFAKWLLANPKILIVDEPTRGIDVGAKAEIFRIIRELATQGTSIIVISSDLPEVLTLSDRIIVMYNGTITGELTRHEATEENIMHLASGFSRKEEMMV
jgi:ribose transport system ATP-binding protein